MVERSDLTVIPKELAERAVAVLEELMDGERAESRKDGIRHRSAESLVRLYQTQVKYGSERVKELAAMPKASQSISDLASLTDDELNEMTCRMLGKPFAS